MTCDANRYDQFVSRSPQGTLFCTTWWLNAVAPNFHRILTVEEGGEVQAAWPIVVRSFPIIGSLLTHTPLTPWLGVLYAPAGREKTCTRLAREQRLATELIAKLPPFGALSTHFHRNFGYWSPFFWHGFSETTRYTYVLEPLDDLDRIWEGMRENIRREIRKAQSSGVAVEIAEDLEDLWSAHKLTFARQGLPMPYGLGFVRRIDEACAARGARRIFIGRGRDGGVHAAAYVVWDERSAYYLLGGSDPAQRSSGAASLVLWEAIRFSSTVAPCFDFEGSMMEPVDRFFRSFGAKPCPFSVISKIRSPLWRAAYGAKSGLGKWALSVRRLSPSINRWR